MLSLSAAQRRLPAGIGLLILAVLSAGVAWFSLFTGERIVESTESVYAERAAEQNRVLEEYLRERKVPPEPN